MMYLNIYHVSIYMCVIFLFTTIIFIYNCKVLCTNRVFNWIEDIMSRIRADYTNPS